MSLVVLASCSTASDTATTVLVPPTTVPGSPATAAPTSAPTTTAADGDGFWFSDLGVVGYPSQPVGSRPFYNFVSIGNIGSEPIRVDRVEFPELDAGLRIVRVGLWPENEPERAPGTAPFPDEVRPIDGTVFLEPTGGDVDVPYDDPRFYAIYVEAEVLADGQWSVGPMDLTLTEAGRTFTRRVSNQVGDACTTPPDVTCMPWST